MYAIRSYYGIDIAGHVPKGVEAVAIYDMDLGERLERGEERNNFV